MSSATYIFVNGTGYSLLAFQLPFDPFWWIAGGFSYRLLLILSSFRTVKMFISMGQILVPFLTILVACRGCTVQCPVEPVYGEVMPRSHDYTLLGRWA